MSAIAGGGGNVVGGPGAGNASSRNSSLKCVFVGNIPYDASEQDLIEIFQEVGPVVSFRLVYDRDTGKMKGFGFCEFRDSETALSAMRNLNNFDMNGRLLRVDYAENEKSIATGGPGAFERGIGTNGTSGGTAGNPDWGRQQQSTSAPEQKADIPPQMAIALQGMSPPQLYDALSKMKVFIQNSPEHARQVLLANPHLATAFLHAQIVLGMVTPTVVQQIIAHATSKQQQSQPQQPQPTPNTGFGGAPIFQQNMGQMGPNQMGPQSQMGPNQMGNQMGSSPMGQMGMGPQMGNQMGMGVNQMPPNQMGQMGNIGNQMGPPNQMGANQMMGGNQMGMGGGMGMMLGPMGPNQMGVNQMANQMNMGMGPNQGNPMAGFNPNVGEGDLQALLHQVINLTPSQIDNLPPQQRQQVLLLKQYWGNQNMGGSAPLLPIKQDPR